MKYLLGNGNMLDLNNPTISEKDIPCIARSLSRLPRSCGHFEPFYSVAQHSIEVAMYLEKSFPLNSAENCKFIRTALFHEITEACGLGDVATPVKRYLGDVAEDRIKEYEKKLCKCLDLAHPFDSLIHLADTIILLAEFRKYSEYPNPEIEQRYGELPKHVLTSEPYDMETAERHFLAYYKHIKQIEDSYGPDK